jgi:hypothetical protein
MENSITAERFRELIDSQIRVFTINKVKPHLIVVSAFAAHILRSGYIEAFDPCIKVEEVAERGHEGTLFGIPVYRTDIYDSLTSLFPVRVL